MPDSHIYYWCGLNPHIIFYIYLLYPLPQLRLAIEIKIYTYVFHASINKQPKYLRIFPTFILRIYLHLYMHRDDLHAPRTREINSSPSSVCTRNGAYAPDSFSRTFLLHKIIIRRSSLLCRYTRIYIETAELQTASLSPRRLFYYILAEILRRRMKNHWGESFFDCKNCWSLKWKRNAICRYTHMLYTYVHNIYLMQNLLVKFRTRTWFFQVEREVYIDRKSIIVSTSGGLIFFFCQKKCIIFHDEIINDGIYASELN